jgi:hypothetical protein
MATVRNSPTLGMHEHLRLQALQGTSDAISI